MSKKEVITDTELKEYYDGMKNSYLGPLWYDLGHMVTKEPVHDVEPYLWKWKTIRNYVMKAGEILEPGKDAERRVVYLQNPNLLKHGLVGYGTHTLYAGIQLLLPGEFAPSHHHSQGAIRFIIEGSGAYTAVNGEKVYMERGDMILTPAWTWHEHKHEGTEPMIWLDGLDVGLVKNLAASFFEPYENGFYPEQPPENYSTEKFAKGAFVPKGKKEKPGYPSPIIGYKWERAKYVLEQMSKSPKENEDPYDGYAIEYINPTTGGSADERIGSMMQRLLPNQHTKAHRHVHSAIYHVLEGKGYTVINGQKFEWERGDFFILPPWSWHEHVNEGSEDAYLFSFNDKPVMDILGLEYEEAHPEGHQKIEKVFTPGP
ncbi:cupin domain-containing protein [Aeribacillus pallidus]|jgi:Gentisate 1,2-dioxygenase|uniref:cupin domain-containing protein n=1 Tax=Aeribacillus pallidus TaxID=33936 RepID=UPI00102367CA|nr:cupin domain-containing protein [Aeribacillus pallidus]RZI52375.1 cupin domain-containing protein [Aeribacillus pallidus]